MIVLGLNSAYHESAAALIVDGRLVAFVEEERINRRKHGKPALISNPDLFPAGAIEQCLGMAGLRKNQVDYVAYSFAETGRIGNVGLDKQPKAGSWGTEEGEKIFQETLQRIPAKLEAFLERSLTDRFSWVPHHMAHAASAFFCSPFERALILIVDGIGEVDSLMVAQGEGTTITPLFSLRYPHSIGFLWEKCSKFLGFSEYDACKVMGLAGYGNPKTLRKPFGQLAWPTPEGFAVNPELAQFRMADFRTLESLFGSARLPEGSIEGSHKDLAAVLQQFTEETLLALTRQWRERTGATNLCLAGGVTLNCRMNAFLEARSGFQGLFVQPAAHDAGSALGAALFAWHSRSGCPREFLLEHAFWGPEYRSEHIEAALSTHGLTWRRVDDPAGVAAGLLAEGNILAWFEGRMEMGPRALGHRSLLADPRRNDMREILNRKVKHREPFRPFAPSVLEEKAGDWFLVPPGSQPAKYMLGTYPAKESRLADIPAVLHVDGTSRLQIVNRTTTPRFHQLITEFERKTGVPMVLNTSFNDSEPIVMSPLDAVNTFSKTSIDAMLLEDYLVERPKSGE
jgi:carbamoyltransferase